MIGKQSVRILKTLAFSKFSKHEKISDKAVLNIAQEIESGLTGDALGNLVYKKRAANSGKGKRSGFRLIYIFKNDNRIIFVEGYAKHEKSTLSPKELKTVKKAATVMLSWTDDELNKLLVAGVLQEINHEDQ